VGDPFWGRGEEEEAHPRRLSAAVHIGRKGTRGGRPEERWREAVVRSVSTAASRWSSWTCRRSEQVVCVEALSCGGAEGNRSQWRSIAVVGVRGWSRRSPVLAWGSRRRRRQYGEARRVGRDVRRRPTIFKDLATWPMEGAWMLGGRRSLTSRLSARKRSLTSGPRVRLFPNTK
jgi:hypothetical protein